MVGDLERRGALALLAIPLGAALVAPSSAKAAPVAAPPVTFDTWLQVNTLVQTYSDCLDRLDFNGLVKIFTEDATYDYAPGAVKVGRSAIRDFLEAALISQARTIHFVGVPAITPGKDQGTYSSWTSFMARHEGKNGQNHTVYGRYVDALQPNPDSGSLLIARRKVVSQISEGTTGQRYWLERGA
jgi:hypothetical protein